MARLARIVVPQVPYHITQRGNRRQPVFFEEADYRVYLHLLHEQAQRWGLQIWAYCLMTNHIHLIVVPDSDQGLARGLGETHRRYTRAINFREGWRGYLWQGRFASVPLDEAHLIAAMRYIEQNPVAAGLVAHAEEYPWSSARAHMSEVSDPVLSPHPLAGDHSGLARLLAHRGRSHDHAALRTTTADGTASRRGSVPRQSRSAARTASPEATARAPTGN